MSRVFWATEQDLRGRAGVQWSKWLGVGKEPRITSFKTPGTCSLGCHSALHETGDLRGNPTGSGPDYRQINSGRSVFALKLVAGKVLTEGVSLMQSRQM